MNKHKQEDYSASFTKRFNDSVVIKTKSEFIKSNLSIESIQGIFNEHKLDLIFGQAVVQSKGSNKTEHPEWYSNMQFIQMNKIRGKVATKIFLLVKASHPYLDELLKELNSYIDYISEELMKKDDMRTYSKKTFEIGLKYS